MKQSHKTFALWAVMILIFISVLHRFYQPQPFEHSIQFNEFIKDVESKNIQDVTFAPSKNEIFGKFKPTYKNGGKFRTVGNTGDEIFKICKDNGLVPNYINSEPPFWQPLLLQVGPALLLILLMVFFIRQMQVGGGKAMSFGKSRARLLTENQ